MMAAPDSFFVRDYLHTKREITILPKRGDNP